MTKLCCIGVLYFWEDYFVKIVGCLKLMILYWLIFLLVDFQVDTNRESPDDFVTDGVPGIGSTYNIAPYSSILLEAKLWDDIRSYLLMKFSVCLFWSGWPIGTWRKIQVPCIQDSVGSKDVDEAMPWKECRHALIPKQNFW